MARFILKYRGVIIAVSVLLGLGFGLLIPLAKTDPEIRNYIPVTMPSRLSTDSIEQTFGSQDMIIAVFSDTSILTPENLRIIKDVDRAFSHIKGIGKVNSLYNARDIKSEDGMMVVDPLVDGTPHTAEDMEVLKKKIDDNKFARGIVVSPDYGAAAVTGTVSADTPEHITLARIDSVLSVHKGKADIHTGGLPYIRRYIMKDVQEDALILIPLALVIMLVVLKLTLGEWKSVLIPFTVVVLSTAFSMGLIPLLGWKISIISLLVPIILISVANNYGIYLVAGHHELSRTGMMTGKDETVGALTGLLNKPILFSGLTTVAGILGLLSHSIIPARQLGILAAIGVSLALLMSLFFIPALLSYRKSLGRKLLERKNDRDLLGRFIERMSGAVVRQPGRVLIITAIVTIIVSTGSFILRTDTNQENYFPSKHPVKQASGIINSKFGGSQTISIMVSGDIKDPAVMQGIDDLTRHLEKLEGVGNVFSISEVVRAMSKALYDPSEAEYDRIPDSYEAIAQMFELYNMSGDPDDFSQLMNFENNRAHLLIQLSKPDNNIIKKIRNDIKDFVRDFPAKVTVGGYAIIMADFAQKIISGQVTSLVFALVTVFILLAIIFRSVRGGLAGSIPLAASILIQFGIMGFAGIALDAATALLSSIMIGVGVDFTIQFFWRYNHELRAGLPHSDAIRKTYRTTGRPIIINALGVMAGFSATFFSGFVSIRFFGYMILLSIGACLIYAIIVMPAFLLWFKPKFIEADLNNKNKKRDKNGKEIISNIAPSVVRGYSGTVTTAGSGAANAEKP